MVFCDKSTCLSIYICVLVAWSFLGDMQGVSPHA
jgi:hypothetical protein